MKVLWFSKTGHMKMERIKSNIMLFEAIDGGYHPIPDEAVYRDRERKDEGIVIIWQNVTMPEGVSNSKSKICDIAKDIYISRLISQSIPTSKRWMRALSRFMSALGKISASTLVIVIVLLLIAYSFLGGI